jgi:hypothetical protein
MKTEAKKVDLTKLDKLTADQTKALNKIDSVFTRLFDNDSIQFTGEVVWVEDEITDSKTLVVTPITYYALELTKESKGGVKHVAVSTFKKVDYLGQPVNENYYGLHLIDLAAKLKSQVLNIQIVPTTMTTFDKVTSQPNGTKVSGVVRFVGLDQNAIAL